jgi:hypothetical protein
MSRWFRHYAGMVRDDKLVRASIKSKQSIERVVWIWGAVLESAAEFDDEGRYEVEPEEIARFLRCKASAVESVLSALEGLGRITDGHVTTWSKRQFKSDKSNDRVTAYRAKKKVEGNVDVTLPERDGNPPETETETEVSVANATAAKPIEIVDPEKVMFDRGKAFLNTQGIAPGRSGPILGKWKRDHGAEAVIVALGKAQREGAIDPISFIEGCFKNGTDRNNGRAPARSTNGFLNACDEAEANLRTAANR